MSFRALSLDTDTLCVINGDRNENKLFFVCWNL